MATTPTSIVTNAVDGLKDDVLVIGGIGLGVGAALFALRKGWSVVKSMAS